MSASATRSPTKPILAAGGIVLGTGKNSGKILIIRRQRYGRELALPKGKQRKGESEIDAALREVNEETGCKVRIREFAGTTHYLVGRVPKAVFYFIMETNDEDCDGPVDTAEVETIEWITPQDAVAALSHREDRDLVSAVFAIAGGGAA